VVVVGRRSSREIVEDIGQALTTEPQSVTEISEEMDGRPKHVGKWLQSLKAAGLIEGEKQGTKKLYWKPDAVVLEVVEQD
jgi:predicted transcriptional regulator